MRPSSCSSQIGPVCVCVCMCVCVCVCAWVCVSACVRERVHLRARVHELPAVWIWTNLLGCMTRGLLRCGWFTGWLAEQCAIREATRLPHRV